MRIRLWNAFASNNIGSYTIVGRFRFADDTQRLALQLRTVFEEHSRWRLSERPSADSPLGVFLRSRGIPAEPDLAGNGSDEWPDYWDKDWPEVAVVGNSLLIHCGYTVTLPRELGQLIYAAGGRVAVELDHAHDPLVALVRIYWTCREAERELRSTACLELLQRADAPWRRYAAPGIEPRVWRGTRDWGGAIHVAAVFADLVAGCEALSDAAVSHSGIVILDLSESCGQPDPLAAFPTSS